MHLHPHPKIKPHECLTYAPINKLPTMLHRIQIQASHRAVSKCQVDYIRPSVYSFSKQISIALSLSGRYLFCGSDDNSVHTWDTLKTNYTGPLALKLIRKFQIVNRLLMIRFYVLNKLFVGSLNGHDNRVTSVTIAPNGMALVSCSWDQYVRVWG